MPSLKPFTVQRDMVVTQSGLVIGAIATAVAVLGGLAAAFGAVLIVGLLAAALVGTGLLLSPRVHLSFGLFFALAVTGVMEFFFFFGQANWLSSLLVGSMLVPAVLRLIWSPVRHSYGPAYGLLIVCYFGLLAFSTALNTVDLPQAIVGLRNYVPYSGVALLLVYGSFAPSFVRKLPQMLLAIGLIQAPFALVQFFVVGPWRNSLRNAIGRADEAIVGTFGGSAVTGGYTGEMASFLVMLVVFVLAMKRDKILSAWLTALICSVLLIPILLAETKVSLVLLPVLIAVCFSVDVKRNPGFVVLLMTLGALFVAAIATTYYIRYWQDGSVAAQQLGYSFDPNFMVTPSHRGRVGALIHWFQSTAGAGDLLHALMGFGVASTLEGSMTIGFGSAVKEFGLGLDSHAMSRLLWDGGIASFGVFAAIILRSFWISLAQSRSSSVVGIDRSIATFCAAASLGMFLMLPYQVSVLGGSAMQFLFWFTVGLSEYMRRRGMRPS